MMAPSSQKRQKIIESCDRFSDLPDLIIYRILSFLKENDTARISLLSRRFRQLCVTSPYLSFKLCLDHKECTSKCGKFSDFLDRLLSLRKEKEIYRLRLHWNCTRPNNYKEGSLFDTWVHNAVKCKVRELDLMFRPTYGEGFVLPHCILSCQYLRVFKLDLGGGSLEFPSVAFPYLEVLSLQRVEVVNGSFGEWISASCFSLKKLNLVSVRGFANLYITSSSLEDFRICDSFFNEVNHINISTGSLLRLSIHVRFHGGSTASMKIDAPNLRFFKWKDATVIDNSYFGNFTSLQEAAISVKDHYHYRNGDSNKGFLISLLGRLSSARVLKLQDWMIESLVGQGCLPISFGKVHHLVVKTGSLKDFKIPAMATFLEGFVNLEILIIKLDEDSEMSNFEFEESNFKQEYGDYQNHTLSDKLKEVEIDFVRETNETGLVKYLLRKAKGLEKMTIYYSSSCLYKLSDIGVQNIEEISPTVEVSLWPKEFDKNLSYSYPLGGCC